MSFTYMWSIRPAFHTFDVFSSLDDFGGVSGDWARYWEK